MVGKVTDALSPGPEKQAYEAPDLEWLKTVLGALKSVEAGDGPHQVVRPFRVRSYYVQSMWEGPVVAFTDDVIVEEVPKVLRELELVKKDLETATRELSRLAARSLEINPVLNQLHRNFDDRLVAEVELNRG